MGQIWDNFPAVARITHHTDRFIRTLMLFITGIWASSLLLLWLIQDTPVLAHLSTGVHHQFVAGVTVQALTAYAVVIPAVLILLIAGGLHRRGAQPRRTRPSSPTVRRINQRAAIVLPVAAVLLATVLGLIAAWTAR
jgi:hypothetical protein